MEIRLNKLLAQRGIASRRGADRMIHEGRISVNGQVVQELGSKIDDATDRVVVDGRAIKPGRTFVYILLNKPKGFLVTLRDPLGRATVRNLIPSLPEGVNPVGRLDKDTEGLLLLTNDGDLAFRLAHPRYEVPKIYSVCVQGEMTGKEVEKLERGVFLEGRKTAPAKVTILGSHTQRSVLRLEIHEGRKREVRKMLAAVGHEVIALKRVSFAGLKLENLPSGKWRFLKRDEVGKLKRRVGLEAS
jgi:pseudouridine synthase